jgi:hypothetical protein
LKNYIRIPDIILKDLKSTVKKQTYILYRGLNFDEKSRDLRQLVDTIMKSYSTIKLGDTLNITINNDISSWTTDVDVAKIFSKKSGKPYSIILKCSVSYKDVIADLTELDINDEEKEILLKPGKYLVTIDSIFKNANPVLSVTEWDKEISIDDDEMSLDTKTNDIKNIYNWKRVGKQLGSNPGGLFKDERGIHWYCKFLQNENIVDNEILANMLYSAALIKVPTVQKIQLNNQIGIASLMVDGKKDIKKLTSGKLKGLFEGFAVDAWLANWDVVGIDYENLLVSEKYGAIRIDTGGTLLYRAQGEPKGNLFTDYVNEIKTFLDKNINYWTWSVFKDITIDDIKNSIKRIGKIPDIDIANIINKYGPGNEIEKAQLLKKLILRKKYLLTHYL